MRLGLSLSVAVILLSGLLHADEPSKETKLLYDRDAVLLICKKGIVGCAHKIRIDKEEYLVDALGAQAKKDYHALIGANQFHGVLESVPGTVAGFVVEEKGHFPNPTVSFSVFKALTLDFALPKGKVKDVEKEEK